MSFKGLVVTGLGQEYPITVQALDEDQLPDGDVAVAVAYSSLNYKDALAVTGKGKVIRTFPMVPGIDLAGVVESSRSDRFSAGEAVFATGWGLAEEHWGGYAQKARLPANWLLPLPPGLELRSAMALGTAGLTAMMSLMAMEANGLKPGGDVVVTGAAGGVGSLAIALLAQNGYRVAASTGRRELSAYLTGLGATEIIDRQTFSAPSKRPLDRGRWAGAIDNVGGDILAGVLRSMDYGGCVASVGLAGGHALHTTVFPFILRGVRLLGIDSVRCPEGQRREAWDRLSRELPVDALNQITQEISLEQVPAMAEELLASRVRGRVVVKVR